jgi:hypothetical protein
LGFKGHSVLAYPSSPIRNLNGSDAFKKLGKAMSGLIKRVLAGALARGVASLKMIRRTFSTCPVFHFEKL